MFRVEYVPLVERERLAHEYLLLALFCPKYDAFEQV